MLRDAAPEKRSAPTALTVPSRLDWGRSELQRVWATVAYAAAAWRHDIDRPRERVGEIDNHGDWAASDATLLLYAAGVPAEQGTAIEGDR
ncbi:hypothetical protein SAMN05216388_104610 [Halorientalis persicus]|uniref:Uncharacterized protein n=1 Tax=Halorientalis persicus TaxID=1367881 RepID=A0A1H8W1W6_9EURY|nr:hypothetical protein SAMN05216388_104610 [Halorientalis persicus]